MAQCIRRHCCVSASQGTALHTTPLQVHCAPQHNLRAHKMPAPRWHTSQASKPTWSLAFSTGSVPGGRNCWPPGSATESRAAAARPSLQAFTRARTASSLEAASDRSARGSAAGSAPAAARSSRAAPAVCDARRASCWLWAEYHRCSPACMVGKRQEKRAEEAGKQAIQLELLTQITECWPPLEEPAAAGITGHGALHSPAHPPAAAVLPCCPAPLPCPALPEAAAAG